MNESQRFRISVAKQDSSDALKVAKVHAGRLEKLAAALSKLTSLVAGKPVASQSGDPAVGASATTVAKTILSNPKVLQWGER